METFEVIKCWIKYKSIYIQKSFGKICLFIFLLHFSNLRIRCFILGSKQWINSSKFIHNFARKIQVIRKSKKLNLNKKKLNRQSLPVIFLINLLEEYLLPKYTFLTVKIFKNSKKNENWRKRKSKSSIEKKKKLRWHDTGFLILLNQVFSENFNVVSPLLSLPSSTGVSYDYYCYNCCSGCWHCPDASFVPHQKPYFHGNYLNYYNCICQCLKAVAGVSLLITDSFCFVFFLQLRVRTIKHISLNTTE